MQQNGSMESSLNEFLSTLKFNNDGLIVAIAQDDSSKRVLMQAWMSKESIIKTIQTHKVTYFSRSRNQLWIKGETSGNGQELIRISADCDGDSLLLTVKQNGPACHSGQESCFDVGIAIERVQ
jgi:phosphoribosyl-AMP cyclohydrolase